MGEKFDNDQNCKCGKPMPIVPYACDKCKQGSMKGKKIKVVELGNKTLPSGLKIK